MARESFEVYYNQNERWQLHASYEASQREQAIEDAKGIEAKEGFPSRVMRETLSEETNTSDATITWQSATAKNMNDADNMFGEKKETAKKKKRPAPPRQRSSPAQSRPEPSRPEQPRSERSKPKSSPPSAAGQKRPRKPKLKKRRGAVVRFLLAIAVSIGLSGVSFLAVFIVVFELVSLGMLPPGNRLPLISGTTVLVFFLALFVNFQRQFNIIGMLTGARSRSAPASNPARMMEAVKSPPSQLRMSSSIKSRLKTCATLSWWRK